MSSKKKSLNIPKKHPLKKTNSQQTKADRNSLWTSAAVISIITFLVYLPVFSNAFVNWDDGRYIESQPLTHVIDIKSCFTTFIEGNYHPLVMLVYSIIYHFFQMNATAYHLVNLLLHIFNTGLVLWLIYLLSKSLPIAFIVSLLFGIHPLHVESVAWASELKDLMYTLGFLCSLIYYVRYVKENQPTRLYVLSLLFFIFSLFSKGMGVSLSLVLLLVDFYLERKITAKVIIEKIPFLALSVVFGVVAILAQKSSGYFQDIPFFTLPQRIVFAGYSYIIYIIRLFVPLNLCAFNPYPIKAGDSVPGTYYIYLIMAILLFTATLYSLRKTKKIFFGIGFFTLTVFLVLQLLPVGSAITADRYTYIPSIGIFYLVAEGLVYLSKRLNPSSSFSPLAVGILGAFVLFLSFQTYNQVKIWKNGVTLWSRVLDNYQTVSLAYMYRGEAYTASGNLDGALEDYNHSLQMDPKNADVWCNVGLIYWQQGSDDKSRATELLPKALDNFNKALEIKPDFAIAVENRGAVHYAMGYKDAAIKDFSTSIEIDSSFADPYYNRGIAYYNSGRSEEACADLKRAARLGYSHAIDAVKDLCK